MSTGARPDTWMPLYIGDYLADTMHLTRDQHGGYILLIMAYWRRGGPLPDDDEKLAGIVKASPAEWRKLRPVLAEFFIVADGVWTQKRAQEELDDATKITNERSNAGSKGAAKRWQLHRQSDDNAMANASQTDAPLPLHSLSREREGERASAPLPPDWILPDEWRVEAEKARTDNGLPSANLDLAAASFRAHTEGQSRKNWHGDWLKWALKEHAGKGANGHAAEPPLSGDPDPAKEAARIAGMIATMVKAGKRLFPMAVSDRQLVAACRANTLPRELLEQWFGPNTVAEMLR